MGIADWKRREVERREHELLSSALLLAEEGGIGALQLGTLAERSEYSRGTIYNHFHSREDLITALCVYALRLQIDLLAKVAKIDARSRARMLAMHQAYRSYAERYPTLFLCVLSALAPTVMTNASSERLEERHLLDKELAGLVNGVVQSGIDSGDLARPSSEVAVISFVNRSLSFGSLALLLATEEEGPWLEGTGTTRVDQAFLFNVNTLLDGLGWRPLSDTFDFHEVWRQAGLAVGHLLPANPFDDSRFLMSGKTVTPT